MRVAWSVCVVLVLGAFLVSAAELDPELQKIIEAVDAAHARYDLQAQGAREALKLLDEALQKYPDEYELLWRVGRSCFWICDRTEDEDIKREFGWKGAEAARRAYEMKPDRVEGHYFYAICIGEYGKGISIPKAVFKGIDKKIRTHAERVLEIDPSFERAGALRTLGRLYFKLPWPKHDAEKSIEYLKRAIEVAPQVPRSYYYLAETYADEEMWAEARETLQKMFALPRDEHSPAEQEYFNQLGKKLLQKIAEEED